MPTYNLYPADKNSIVELTIWQKSNAIIEITNTWKRGYISFTTNDDLEIDLDNEDDLDISKLPIKDDLDSGFEDGIYDELEFFGMDDENEQTRIQECFDEDGEDGLVNDGWVEGESTTTFVGPLVLERLPD